jgi:hypothetical protein
MEDVFRDYSCPSIPSKLVGIGVPAAESGVGPVKVSWLDALSAGLPQQLPETLETATRQAIQFPYQAPVKPVNGFSEV